MDILTAWENAEKIARARMEAAAARQAAEEKPGAYERDVAIVDRILAPGHVPTAAERAALIRIVGIGRHTSGKIEGVDSVDSSCTGCDFCGKMRAGMPEGAEILQQHAPKAYGAYIQALLDAGHAVPVCWLCYDWTQEHSYKARSLRRHALNMRIMSSVLFSVEELAALPVFAHLLRENSSGDVTGVIMARNYIRIARAFPWCRVALWFKNVPAVEMAVSLEGRPDNMTFIQSSIFINRRCSLSPVADYSFTVYDAAHISAAIASGARTCNGNKCRACGYRCYTGGWNRGDDIAELLRIS